MLPELNTDIETQNIEYQLAATKTYRFDIANKRIQGMTDGLEAYKIAAEKALKTKRYAHIIYNGNYGTDLESYIGEDFDFIKTAIQREIYETLSQDDRFESIDDFIIQQNGIDHCIIKFNIVSTEGTFSTELEV